MAKRKSVNDILEQNARIKRLAQYMYGGAYLTQENNERLAKRLKKANDITRQYLKNITSKLGDTDIEVLDKKVSRRIYQATKAKNET